MKRRLTICTVAVVVTAALVLAGCTKAAPTPAPKPPPATSPKPAPAAPAAPTPAPKPAPAKPASPTPPSKPAASSAADFYRDNPITIISPLAAGGGVDYAARLLASFWSDVSNGGSAKVRNVTGAGGVAGLNQAVTMKADGLTIVTSVLGTNVLLPWAFKTPGVNYDPRKLIMIGSPVGEVGVFSVSSKLPYTSIKDIPKTAEFKLGATGVRSSPAIQAAMLADILGLEKASVVAGFGGTNDIAVSMGKGETDGMVISPPGTAQFVQRGFIKKPFAVMDTKKTPWFPDTPTLPDVVKLTAEQERLFTLYRGFQPGFAHFFAVDGVPPERVEFVRDAFVKMSKLAGYKQLYGLQWTTWEDPVPGKDLQDMVQKALTTVKDADLAKLTDLVNKYKK